MDKKKEESLIKLFIKKMKGNPILLSIPIVLLLLIIVLIVILFNIFLSKPSDKFIVKEVAHEISGDKIKIIYTIKNDSKDPRKMDSVMIDLKDKDGKVIGGYLVPVNINFEKKEKQEYTIERIIPTSGNIDSLSFRCEGCQ